jgi:3-isopropylmalate/(R)-2-methylmalate dehydratase small subunit
VEIFTKHVGYGALLPVDNIDTDQIIPSRFLKRISRYGFEDGLFAEWRDDENFVLNKQSAKEISFLVVGENFGCGSSREHAVWAIQDYGIRAVIAPSFADIFRGNAGNAGLVLAKLDGGDARNLWRSMEADSLIEITLDLEEKVVRYHDQVVSFEIDDFTREKLLKGLDDIEVTLAHADEIERFESQIPAWRPSIR